MKIIKELGFAEDLRLDDILESEDAAEVDEIDIYSHTWLDELSKSYPQLCWISKGVEHKNAWSDYSVEDLEQANVIQAAVLEDKNGLKSLSVHVDPETLKFHIEKEEM